MKMRGTFSPFPFLSGEKIRWSENSLSFFFFLIQIPSSIVARVLQLRSFVVYLPQETGIQELLQGEIVECAWMHCI